MRSTLVFMVTNVSVSSAQAIETFTLVAEKRDFAHHIKVGDDLVEDSQALCSVLIKHVFAVQLAVVGNGCKDDTHVLERLVVELVRRVLAVQVPLSCIGEVLRRRRVHGGKGKEKLAKRT